jgi:5,10-methylenetetrahydromethanopterin reductase
VEFMPNDLSRFGIYVLPGRINDPARGITEAQEAERLGFKGVWISERYALKEPAVLCGAMTYATTRIQIRGTMYANMRHPIVSASIANVLQALSHNRFSLVLARSVKQVFADMGLPPLTFERLADFIGIIRRLWAGETVRYEGILGTFPKLLLADRYSSPATPIIFTAIGPKALAFAGEHCDGVLLHPFLTPEAVNRSASIVRRAAKERGRDPYKVKIYATVVVAPDLPFTDEAAIVGGRAVTYFHSDVIGPLLVEINGWDPNELKRLRAHPMFGTLAGGNADRSFTREQMVVASRELPAFWLAESAAVGDATHCAGRLREYVAAGADEVLLHGAPPSQLGTLLGLLAQQTF